MLASVHEHMLGELQQSARTDTVFVVAAVLFDLIVLGISWGVAGARNDAILAALIALTAAINLFAVRALGSGRGTRLKLLGGLVAMYRDNQVDKYYDASFLEGYATRYRLFTAVIVSLAIAAIAVPLLARFTANDGDAAAALEAAAAYWAKYDGIVRGGDATSFAALYTVGATVNRSGMPPLSGRTAIDSVARGRFAMNRYTGVTVTAVERRAHGQRVYEYGTFVESYRTSGDTAKADFGRYAATLQREQDGQWRIARALAYVDSTVVR